MKILVTLLMLCFATLSVDAQVYKIYKIQLGFQQSAQGLFTCDNMTSHYSHIIIENSPNQQMTMSLYNDKTKAKAFVYHLSDPLTTQSNQIHYDAMRISPHGSRWSDITITTLGNKATIRLENASDMWGGKIFYIYSAKIQKSTKGLENFLYDN